MHVARNPMTERLIATALAWSIVSVPLSAAAEDQTADASQLFEQGLELIEQGAYEQAAIAFNTAYEIEPNYRVLYNVGEAERLVGHHARAMAAYTRYLEEGGDEIDEDRRAYVEEQLALLSGLVGEIQVKCPVPGAVVTVDGRPSGQTPLEGPLAVDAGEHEVAVVKDGEELHRELVVVGGQQTVWVVADQPAEPPPPAAVEQPAVEPEEEPVASPEPVAPPAELEPQEPQRVWTWVVLGLGAASGVAAAVTGNLALGQAREIDRRCDGNVCPAELVDEADRAESLAMAADVLLGATAACAVAGVILYFTEPDLTERSDAATVEVGLGPSALTIGGRF
jgi:hypothetical protein